ncbi:hypothetical protein CBL_07403 [Carabus blaptoides fortunei]
MGDLKVTDVAWKAPRRQDERLNFESANVAGPNVVGINVLGCPCPTSCTAYENVKNIPSVCKTSPSLNLVDSPGPPARELERQGVVLQEMRPTSTNIHWV